MISDRIGYPAPAIDLTLDSAENRVPLVATRYGLSSRGMPG
jgi:hypothetical protein